MFRLTNVPQLNERARRTPMQRTINPKKIVRSSGLPSSKACALIEPWLPIHCDGSRVPRIKSHINGIQSAAEVRLSLAGSKRTSARSISNHHSKAKNGGMYKTSDYQNAIAF